MAIWVNGDTRLVVQGITGKEGAFHALACRDYGTRVVAGIYLAQRRPEVFPEPNRFLPDRFLQQHPSPFEWLPFGGGIRRCIGNASVLVQMKVVLATILRRAVLRPVPGPPVRTVRFYFALAPSGGVPAVLVSRAPRRQPGALQAPQPRA